MPWLDYLLTFDWATTGKTVVSTFTAAGLGSALVPHWFSGRVRRTHAKYLAMRLVVLLDEFGGACCGMIDDNSSSADPSCSTQGRDKRRTP